MRATTRPLSMPLFPSTHHCHDDDDSLLRRWTPMLLRVTLGVAVLLMGVGIALDHPVIVRYWLDGFPSRLPSTATRRRLPRSA